MTSNCSSGVRSDASTVPTYFIHQAQSVGTFRPRIWSGSSRIAGYIRNRLLQLRDQELLHNRPASSHDLAVNVRTEADVFVEMCIRDRLYAVTGDTNEVVEALSNILATGFNDADKAYDCLLYTSRCV